MPCKHKLTPAKPVYCNTETIGRRQTYEVLIRKITTCQSYKNIIEERRNSFQWQFSLARWGFLWGCPSAPLRALWKWIFRTFVKVCEFCSVKNTHRARNRVCLRGCLLARPCASKKLHSADCSWRAACSAHTPTLHAVSLPADHQGAPS